VKYIDHDAHIRVFKKVIRANGETMEVDIINLFGFTLQDILKWGDNFIRIILIAHLMSWNKHFASALKL